MKEKCPIDKIKISCSMLLKYEQNRTVFYFKFQLFISNFHTVKIIEIYCFLNLLLNPSISQLLLHIYKRVINSI